MSQTLIFTVVRTLKGIWRRLRVLCYKTNLNKLRHILLGHSHRTLKLRLKNIFTKMIKHS